MDRDTRRGSQGGYGVAQSVGGDFGEIEITPQTVEKSIDLTPAGRAELIRLSAEEQQAFDNLMRQLETAMARARLERSAAALAADRQQLADQIMRGDAEGLTQAETTAAQEQDASGAAAGSAHNPQPVDKSGKLVSGQNDSFGWSVQDSGQRFGDGDGSGDQAERLGASQRSGEHNPIEGGCPWE